MTQDDHHHLFDLAQGRPFQFAPSFLLSESSHSQQQTPKLKGTSIRPTSNKVSIDDVPVQVLRCVGKFAEHPVVQMKSAACRKRSLVLVDSVDQPLTSISRQHADSVGNQ